MPPFGQEINGTRRWLRLGPVSFQPVELAKLSLLLYLASFLARREEAMATFSRGLLPLLLMAGGMAALTLLQPDMGNAMVLVILTLALAYLGGARVMHMGLIAGAALPLCAVAIAMKPYRLRRMVAFMNPWNDPQGSGFQIIQSFLALGSGGWIGRGLGESKQKLFYLPEAHTDFVFAIIGEEFGIAGAAVVVALFTLLIWRGLRIGLRAPDSFGAFLGLGLTIMLATQTIVNLGVVTGALPTKGLPLPFISSGGSALLMAIYIWLLFARLHLKDEGHEVLGVSLRVFTYDVDDEVGFHLDMRERELVAKGMDPGAAHAGRHRARRLPPT